MLATLTRPDEGVATVGGHDVLRHADRVRRRLDPGRREHLWRIIRELTTAGSTVLLTTQYLEEAATQPG